MKGNSFWCTVVIVIGILIAVNIIVTNQTSAATLSKAKEFKIVTVSMAGVRRISSENGGLGELEAFYKYMEEQLNKNTKEGWKVKDLSLSPSNPHIVFVK